MFADRSAASGELAELTKGDAAELERSLGAATVVRAVSVGPADTVAALESVADVLAELAARS